MIFAIDFDGTIVEEAYPDIGKARQDVVSFIRKLHADGHKWILLTMREGRMLYNALCFLESRWGFQKKRKDDGK